MSDHAPFELKYSRVVDGGTWCPQCAPGSMERSVRGVFDQLFAGNAQPSEPSRFPRSRPEWLLSPFGRPMELDGYWADLRFGFEYHGEHHFEAVARWKLTEDDFARQQARDRAKVDQCLAHGVTVIEIPFTVPRESVAWEIVRQVLESRREDLRNTLIEVARSKGHTWDEQQPWGSGNGPHGHAIFDYRAGAESSIYLARAHEAAKARGGLFHDVAWRGALERYGWSCAHGHHWQATYGSVVCAKAWCAACSGIRKIGAEGLDMAKAAAERRGGKLLSTEWVGAGEQYEWLCGEPGHGSWSALFRSVLQRDAWCPKCARHKAWTTRRARAAAALLGPGGSSAANDPTDAQQAA